MDDLKENNKDIVFYKSLLFKAGIIVFAALLLSVILGAQHTYYLVMEEEEKAALQTAEDASAMLAFGMREDFLEHMFDYWESNYEKMDFMSPEEEKNGEAVEEWMDTHQEVWEKFLQESSIITPDDFDRMSDEDRLLMAEQMYRFFNNSLDLFISDKLEKEVSGFFVFKYIGDNKAFAWFGKPYGEGREAILGEILPFTPSKHPVASDILETGKMPEKAEHIVSTVDGEEYFYAAWPLVLNGRVKCIIGIQYPWSETKNNLLSRIFQVGGRVLLYMAVADVMLIILLNRTVLRPVKRVQQRICEYSTEKDSSAVEEGLNKINKRQDEIGSLSRDITDLTKEVDRYIDEVSALAEEKAKVGAELSLATTIQAASLPKTFPAFPERKEFDLYAFMKPSLAVSGDFYDYFMIDDDHLALVIADVSDKGVPSALFMMAAQTMIQAFSRSGDGISHPKELFKVINERLREKSKMGMFVTVWMGILEVSSGKIACVNAGHEYPAILRKSRKTDGFLLHKAQHSFPLGALPGATFRDEDLELYKGDVLFVYTDGVTEASDPSGEMFGEERMLAALNDLKDSSPEEIINGVRDAVEGFAGGNDQFDDITMLCLKYSGQ